MSGHGQRNRQGLQGPLASRSRLHDRSDSFGRRHQHQQHLGRRTQSVTHRHRQVLKPKAPEDAAASANTTSATDATSALLSQLSLKAPPSRIKNRARKRDEQINALLKAWVRIEPTGESSMVGSDKMIIASDLGIQARDLRLLESQMSNQASVILCRERAIVINMAFVKTIITTDACYIVNPDNERSVQFMTELKRRLQEPLKLSKSAGRLAGGPGQDWGTPAFGLELPFELRVLEICLDELTADLDERASQLEAAGYPAVDAMAKQADRPNLDRVRRVKNSLMQLYKTTETFHEALEELLDNDKDMWELNLGAKGAARQMAEEEAAIAAAGLPDPSHLTPVAEDMPGRRSEIPQLLMPLAAVQEDEELVLGDDELILHQLRMQSGVPQHVQQLQQQPETIPEAEHHEEEEEAAGEGEEEGHHRAGGAGWEQHEQHQGDHPSESVTGLESWLRSGSLVVTPPAGSPAVQFQQSGGSPFAATCQMPFDTSDNGVSRGSLEHTSLQGSSPHAHSPFGGSPPTSLAGTPMTFDAWGDRPSLGHVLCAAVQNASLSRLSRRSIAALSMRHGSSLASSSALSSVYDMEVAEVEMLLDAYFIHVNSINRKLKTLKEYIEDTEEMVYSSLNAKRNKLLAYDLCFIGINAISMVVTGVTGLFAMNLFHPEEGFMSDPWTFVELGIASLAAYLLFGGLLAYYMHTGVVQFT